MLMLAFCPSAPATALIWFAELEPWCSILFAYPSMIAAQTCHLQYQRFVCFRASRDGGTGSVANDFPNNPHIDVSASW